MIPANLAQWALRHHIGADALHDLSILLGMDTLAPVPSGADAQRDEAWVQSRVRLEAAQKGARLWRNNVGVLEDKTGRPVRYGLANDSKALNDKLKSSDLIGWKRVTITPDMVGRTIAQFMARECKPQGWTYSATPREVAQAAWIQLVAVEGGDAAFASDVGTI